MTLAQLARRLRLFRFVFYYFCRNRSGSRIFSARRFSARRCRTFCGGGKTEFLDYADFSVCRGGRRRCGRLSIPADKSDKAIFNRPKSRFFNPKHLKKAHDFYEKHGGKTIIIARFVPIVRTFAPIVAGAAEMKYRDFFFYNILGGFFWVFSMLLAGYFLGGVVEQIMQSWFGIPNFKLEEHIDKVVIVVVFLSILPIIIEYLKAKFGKSKFEEEVGIDI